MKAVRLYEQLEKDFITPALTDDWARHMSSVSEFLTDNFRKRSMGLVCDNSNLIHKVYTAVFPSTKIMQHILNTKEDNVLLFVHHPQDWDITKPEVFRPMDSTLLQRFKERKISIYNLHVPLDNFGEYSIATSFAKALGVEIEKPFGFYHGGLGGVLGRTAIPTVVDLSRHFTSIIGHQTSLYQYGSDVVVDGRVALAPGGNMPSILSGVAVEGINTLLTGISALNDHTRIAHEFAQERKINILGGTHYSTEKFACIGMCKYFQKLGLSCTFIKGSPMLEDL